MTDSNDMSKTLFILKQKTEDDILLDGIVAGLKASGYSGEDISYGVIQALKRIGRYDLLPPCEVNKKENTDAG